METKYIIIREEKSLETWVNAFHKDFDSWKDAYYWLKNKDDLEKGRYAIVAIFIFGGN